MSVKEEGKGKKETIRARNKRIHRIMEAERIHESNRQEIKASQERKEPEKMGGFSKPVDEEVSLDWRERTQSMRYNIRKRREKAKAMWRGR